MLGTVKLRGKVEDGLMPAEKIFKVENADGVTEEIPVSNGSISDDRLIASQIAQDEGRVLVELPRESTSGRWRIWVKASEVGV